MTDLLDGRRPRIVFLLAAALIVLSFAARPPRRTGDGFEYLYTLQAWCDHGTPDLRPEDIENFRDVLDRASMLFGLRNDRPYKGFVKSDSGPYFSLHFWMYPLTAVPAKAALSLLGGNEVAALQATNATLFVIALYVALFLGGGSPSQRLMLAGLAAVGPPIWYLEWTTPEAYTWSFTLMSVSFLSARRHGAAALCASFGAMHNPPLVFLAALAVVLSLRERRWGAFLRASAGGALSFLPNAFNLLYFGKFNLLMAKGAFEYDLIGWPRFHSFLFDLNQGILPYAPGLLLLCGLGVLSAARRRDGEGLAGVATTLAVIALCLTQRNWNHGMAGMIKYANWVLPLLAWIAVLHGPSRRRWFAGLALASILFQGAIALGRDGGERYLKHNALARLALDRFPRFYNPDFEIFGERQFGMEGYFWNLLPVPHVREDGVVTKILADRNSLEAIGEWFDTAPGEMERIRARWGATEGLFYIDPHFGKIKAPPVDAAPPDEASLSLVGLEFAQGGTRTTSERIEAKIRVTNGGNTILWGAASGSPHPFGLSSRDEPTPGRRTKFSRRYPIPYMLEPGQSRVVAVHPDTPLSDGDHVIEIVPVLEGVAMGQSPLRLLARVALKGPTEFEVAAIPLGVDDASSATLDRSR